MRNPSRQRLLAWSALMGAAVLLLWPIAPDTPLWELAGVLGGGGSMDVVTTPVSALWSGESFGDGGDRLQLAVGLILFGTALGLGIGAGAFRSPTARMRPEPSPLDSVSVGHQA